ncbi:sperm flagellar protein 1 isoform X2 [Phascolarctos cinereus]|uniref:Sperm flagellar protein 1 n=1 Tax=Phascolarctos cinereus TaxID=38626 RepID=A0A6P5LG61_PHACI|nr:sperm flagellar protein 1 isoform X2 [Phascolarctos cinereus]
MAGGVDEEVLHQLYLWVDNIPLSRPKRNLSRDFSDAVLAAEVVKFYFPKMVEMHNYVPANSVQQKINNWIHLNRKVLHKLNFSVPEDVIQKIAQCSPGVVELVLIPLRQRLEEKKQRKQGELDLQEGSNYMDMDFSQKTPRGGTMEPWKAGQLRGGKLLPAASRAMQGDPNFVVQMAEKEQELLASQETVQVLQMKVRRLEHLLQLKNVRIDDLSRRLQQAQRKPRQKRYPLEPEPRTQTSSLLPEILVTGAAECSMGHPSTLHMLWENMALALISSRTPCKACNWAPSTSALSHLVPSQRGMCQASSRPPLALGQPHHHSKAEPVPCAHLSARSTRAGQGFLRPGHQGQRSGKTQAA